MALSDQLILETRQAFRELDALQGRLDRLSDVRLDVNLDTSTLNADIERSQQLARETASAFGEVKEQVVLTTDEYRQAVRLVEEGVDASRAIAVATGEMAQEATTVEDAFRRVSSTMGLSEDEARDLANAVGRSTVEANELDADLRQVARSMGLSEQEAAQFSTQMRKASGEAQTLDARTQDIGAGWQNVRRLIVGAVAAFGVRGLVRQFDQAIDSTLALSESVNAVNVIFEEGADTVLNFAQTAADAAGLATSEAQQLVVPIGALLRNFGFDAQAAGDAAVILTQRAADLASVFNTDVSEALGAIQAALRGEADPLERFGASISAARVEAFALSEGLAASKGELTDSIRLQARYQLILADTAKAAGDFANTSDEAANQQRTLAADVENARAALGQALLPAFQSILEIAPRFIFDVAAMAESIRVLAGEAEGAEGPLLTLGDTIAGIPRGFGVLTDLATGFGSALGNAAQASFDLFAGPLTGQGFGAFAQNFEEGTDAIEGLFDSLQQRAIMESFIQDLKDGIDPALAFANAAAASARNNELTADSFRALSRIAGLSDDRLLDATRAMIAQGEAAGFDADEIRVLKNELAELLGIERGGTGRGGDRGRRRTTNEVEELAAAAAAAAEEAEVMESALEGLDRISADTGLSVGEVARNIALLEPELVPLVDQIGAGVLASEAFDRALRGLQTATKLDLGDAVAELDLLITKTNEAGDEIPATVAEMIADLQRQANQLAEFEAATTILEALGLDALAADLREQFATDGPGAIAAAEAFLEDFPGAVEADRILKEGGNPGQEYIDQVIKAVEEGNLSPAAEERLKDLTSDQIRQAVVNAATELGGLFGPALIAAIDLRTDLKVPIQLIPEIQGSSGGSDPTGSGAITGSGSGGGGTTFNQTNIFQDNPTPSTDTQRITQATSDILRHVE